MLEISLYITRHSNKILYNVIVSFSPSNIFVYSKEIFMNNKTRILILTIAIFSVILFFILDKESVSITDDITREEARGMDLDISVKEGDRAKDFSLMDIKGEKVTLSDYEDQIVFINFWTSFSEDTADEMKDLEKLDRENDDLTVLAVNVREDIEVVEKFIGQEDLEMKVLLDKTGEIGLLYPIGKLPMTYVIDKEGKLYKKINKKMDYNYMSSLLEEARK